MIRDKIGSIRTPPTAVPFWPIRLSGLLRQPCSLLCSRKPCYHPPARICLQHLDVGMDSDGGNGRMRECQDTDSSCSELEKMLVYNASMRDTRPRNVGIGKIVSPLPLTDPPLELRQGCWKCLPFSHVCRYQFESLAAFCLSC
jgi:hypothetical protein